MGLSSTQNQFLASFLEATESPTCIKDGQHRFLLVNRAFCEVLGLGEVDLIGKVETDLFAPEYAAVSAETEKAVLKDGVIRKSERTLVDATGKSKTLLYTQFRLTVESGEFLVGSSLSDITLLKDAEKRLKESEQRHEIIFERAPVGVAYIGRNGRFKEVNQRFCQILGYVPQELLGQNYGVLVHGDEEWEGRQILPRLLQGEVEQITVEARARRKKGDLVDVALWISGVKSPKGRTDSAVVVLEDIGPRKRAEFLLNAQKEIFEEVAKSSPLSMVASRVVQLVAKDWNGASCAILSFDESQKVFLLEAASGLEPKAETSLKQGVPQEELKDLLPEFSVALIRSNENHALGAFVLKKANGLEESKRFNDWLELGRHLIGIAMEKKFKEEQILNQQVQLFSASRMVTLGEMAAGIAHEINNPLAVIHGRAGQLRDLISKGQMDPLVFDKSMLRIEETAMRIAKIIRGLRSFAREGSSDPFQPARISEILADALEFCKARFKNHAVDLKVEGEIPDDLVLECRFVQLGQVFLNLLGNAFDAVHQLNEKWVKIEIKDLGDSVEISVTDSGTGIPAHIRSKIMDPFFTTKEPGKGTGLGLSITKGIIESHNGSLRLDSQAKNTRFIVQLPKSQAKSNLAA